MEAKLIDEKVRINKADFETKFGELNAERQ